MSQCGICYRDYNTPPVLCKSRSSNGSYVCSPACLHEAKRRDRESEQQEQAKREQRERQEEAAARRRAAEQAAEAEQRRQALLRRLREEPDKLYQLARQKKDALDKLREWKRWAAEHDLEVDLKETDDTLGPVKGWFQRVAELDAQFLEDPDEQALLARMRKEAAAEGFDPADPQYAPYMRGVAKMVGSKIYEDYQAWPPVEVGRFEADWQAAEGYRKEAEAIQPEGENGGCVWRALLAVGLAVAAYWAAGMCVDFIQWLVAGIPWVQGIAGALGVVVFLCAIALPVLWFWHWARIESARQGKRQEAQGKVTVKGDALLEKWKPRAVQHGKRVDPKATQELGL